MRLRYGYVLRCDEVIKDDAGRVVELRCTHEPGTRQGGKCADGRKVKGIIHWVPEAESARATVRLYDRLFDAPNPGAGHEDGDFLRDINPDSLVEMPAAALEPYVAEAPAGTRFQFERAGYFCVDQDSAPGDVRINRVATLRDTWASK